ncbi:MAG: hypothetical protein JEZ14_24800 [Marinilabiliaceae bacterium]|nr:hypothetical protein [Marinilabiliaceae bacterium]
MCLPFFISDGTRIYHCSPISDSTILSSMIAEIPVLEHVRTQLPYALLCGLLSACGFLLLGFII